MIYRLNELTPSDAKLLGREINTLSALSKARYDVADTMVLTTELFDSFVEKGVVEEIHLVRLLQILNAADFGASSHVFLQLSLTENCAGILTNLKVENNYSNLKYNLERVYRSWFSEKARAYRLIYWVDGAPSAPSIFLQQYYDEVDSLVTRSAANGEPTNAKNYADNIDNKVQGFSDSHTNLLDSLERTLKKPIKTYFVRGSGQICKVKDQTMTDLARWHFLEEFFEKGLIGGLDYIRLVRPRMISQFSGYTYEPNDKTLEISGIPVSPGVAKGQLVFTNSRLDSPKIDSFILAAKETSPDDFHLLSQCSGAIQLAGGLMSHFAVICRGLEKPAVIGLRGVELDERNHILYYSAKAVPEFCEIIVDGNLGKVILTNDVDLAPRFIISDDLSPHLHRLCTLIRSFDDPSSFKLLTIKEQLHLASLKQHLRRVGIPV